MRLYGLVEDEAERLGLETGDDEAVDDEAICSDAGRRVTLDGLRKSSSLSSSISSESHGPYPSPSSLSDVPALAKEPSRTESVEIGGGLKDEAR